MDRPGDIFRRKSFPGSAQLGQFADLCDDIGRTITLQKLFNPELFPKNGSLRGLKRLTQDARTQMLADKIVRCWHDQKPDPHEVDMLLKAGVDTEYIHPQAEGATLLGLAARRGYVQCVEELLRHGADLSGKAANKMTPFQQAAWMGQAEVMELLLRRGADIAIRNEHGMTPLMLVVNGLGGRDGRRRSLELLLAHGVSLEDKDNEGRTAMDYFRRNHFGYAAMGWNNDWAKPLLDADAQIAARRKKEEATQRLMNAMRDVGTAGGRTPSPQTLQRYIDDGANIEAIDDFWKTTPLGILAHYNCVAQIQVLIAAGANVSPKAANDLGETPLTTAGFNGYTDLIKLLLDSGAKVDETDNRGKTALISAVDWGCRREAARLLVARGASVTCTDKEGKSALDYCTAGLAKDMNYGDGSARKVYTEMQLILEGGAYRDFLCSRISTLPRMTDDAGFAAALIAGDVNPHLTDGNGWTPLHWAAGCGNEPLMEFLLSKGADIEAKDAADRMPLKHAQLAKNKQAEEYLTNTWPKVRKVLLERLKTEFEGQFEKGAKETVDVSRRIRLKKPRAPGKTP